MGFVAAYFILVFLALELVSFILKKANLDPIATVNKFMIYYHPFNCSFTTQKIPVMNIRPLLISIKKSTVHFFRKTAYLFFNIIHAFFSFRLACELYKAYILLL
jgi:hypothetical protein